MPRFQRPWSRAVLTAGLTAIVALSGSGLAASPVQATTPFVQAWWAWPPLGILNPFSPNAINFNGYVNTPLAYFLEGNGTYVPELATSWQLLTKPNSAANGVLTIHLRRGARWSDGTPMTATDVKDSLELGYIFNYQVNGYIASISTPNNYTVVVRQNNKPFSLFEREILTSWIYPAQVWGRFIPANVASIFITSEGNGKAAKAAQTELSNLAKRIAAYKPSSPAAYVAGGPFKYQSVTSDEVVVVKNPYWWGASRVHVPEVEFLSANGNNQMYAYALSGRADYLSTYAPPTIVDPFLAKPYDHIVAPNGNYGPALVFNTSVKPFNNLAVRQAFAYIINRSEAERIAYPTGTSSMTAATPAIYPNGLPPSFYHTWLTPSALRAMNPYNPNPKKAAELLRSAGLTKVNGQWMYDGKPFSVYIACPAGYSDWVAIAENIATQLTLFGIKSAARTVDTNTYFDEIPSGVYPVALNFIGSSDRFPWYDYADYVGFEGLSINAAGVVSRAKTTYNWGPTVYVKGIGTINFVKVWNNLLETYNVQQQRQDVSELALAVNQQLPAIDILYNKFYAIFYNTSRWTGFPPASNPLWDNAPTDQLSMVALFIENGWIRPAH